jgi:pilus assembly protein CpaE
MQVLSSDAVPAAVPTSEPAVTPGNHVVAFVADDESANALRLALFDVVPDLDIRRGTVRQAIRYFEKESGASAAIVDISGVPEETAELENLARVCPPDLKMLVIGDRTDIGFYRLLVNELGVADYMWKPLTRDMVQRVLLPHLSRRATEPAGGRGAHVVAVCGARGGVGATTVAVSTTLELARIAKGHIALLDLHLQGGAAALMLSARPGPGLRIALEDPERADALFLERTAINVASRVRLIGAEEPFEITPAISDAGVARVLDLLRQKFNFVLIDLPIPMPPSMRQVLALARQVVVVLGPDVASVRDARGIRSMVKVLTGSDRVITVLNRADSKKGLNLKLMEKGLGSPPDITIPDLGPAMLEAFNLGIPALQRVPALGRHLAPLLREIAGTQTAPQRSWLMRMLRA